MRADSSSVISPAEYYDGRHARGWMDRWPDAKKKRVVDLLQEGGLKPGADVLEFGCGVGVFANAAKQSVPSANLHGCDISAVGVERARQLHPSVRFDLAGDVLDRSPGVFDLVYTHHVLEHVEDLKLTIAQVTSLVRPGGRVLHIFPCGNADSLEYRIATMVKDGFLRDGLLWSDDISHARRPDSQTVTHLSEARGLRLIKANFANQFWGGVEYFTGTYHWTILDWFNPSRGINGRAKLQLTVILATFLTIALLRQGPALIFARSREAWTKRRRRWLAAAMPLGIVFAPVAWLLSGLLRQAAALEWKYRKSNPNGSEAYLLFEKPVLDGVPERRHARLGQS